METNIFDIERYFEGSLTHTELEEFENRMNNDKSFAEEVMLFQKAMTVVRHSARLRMKEHFDKLGKDESSVAAVQTFMMYRVIRKQWFAMAASVLFIVGGFFAVRQVVYSTPAGLPSVYEKYYSTPEADFMASRSVGSDKEIENTAITQYSEGQFAEAAGNFSKLLKDPSYSRRSAISFYLGICYINMNMPDSAAKKFEKVYAGSSFGNSALWYKGMAYLLKGDKEMAINVFDSIKNMENHPDKNVAAKISKALSRIK